MICPNCKSETQPGFCCHVCDVFMACPSAGTKASVARRFTAQLLDWILIWIIFFLILALSAAAGSAGRSQAPSLGAFFGTFFWSALGYTIFALWFLAQGKTPGKWLVGVRAVNKRDGRLPGLGRMLVRETIGKFLSGFFLGLGYFWAIWDRDTQAWHDKIAGTLVLRQTAPTTAASRVGAPVSPPATVTTSPPKRNSN